MKKIIFSILSFVLIAFASIGGGLLLSACDYSYSENAGGGFDNSENDETINENPDDADNDAVSGQYTARVYYNSNTSDSVTGMPLTTTRSSDFTISNEPGYWGLSVRISPVRPRRSGYNFVCWNTNSSGTGSNIQPGGSVYVSNRNGTTTARTTLYAIWEVAPSYWLDINTYLDEEFASGGFSGYTFNVYENGNMIYNNATDMYHPISYGSTVKIEISNIPNDSSLWRADYPGGSSTSTTFTFTMPNENSWVNLYFVNPYWLDTNIYIDDEYFIGGVTNFTFNIYENDNMIYNNYTDVYHQIRFRSTVKIELTNMADGYYLSKIAYPGGETSENSATFTMPAENAAITLYFTSHTYSVSFDATNYVYYPYSVGWAATQCEFVGLETAEDNTQILRATMMSVSNDGGPYFNAEALVEGEEYKWTVELRASRTVLLRGVGHEMNGLIAATVNTSWQTFTYTFVASYASHMGHGFVFYSNEWQAGDYLDIRNCSVQKTSDITADNAIGSISVPFNSQYSNLPTPSRTGYTFDGWQLGVDYGPNGIDNYGLTRNFDAEATNRIFPGSDYFNSTFQVGTTIYFDVTWNTGSLNQVDVNDIVIDLDPLTITENRCIGKYTITSDQMINSHSFVDFRFDTRDAVLSVNYFVITGGLDYGPNGINNYSIQAYDQGTKRLQLGDDYVNSTFKVGSVISFDISWDTGSLLNIDINDTYLGEGDYAISDNRCNGTYTITSTNHIGQFSFIDFNFESATTTMTVNKLMVDNIIDENEVVQTPGNHFLFPIWTINTYRLDVNTYVNSLNIYPNEYNYDFLFDIYFDGQLVADDTKDYMNEAVPYNTEVTFEIVQGHTAYDFSYLMYNGNQAMSQNISFNMPANSCEIGVYFVSHVYTATLKYHNGEPDTNLYLKYGVGWYRDSSCTQSVTSVNVPSRSAFTFGGFYSDKNTVGTQTISENGDILAPNTFATSIMTWYAKWTAKNPAQYDEELGKWYVEMGKYPQTKETNSSIISALNTARNNGNTTGSTFRIAGQTLQCYANGGNEYAYYDGSYYKVEPIRYILSGSYTSGYGTESSNVTAISEKVIFATIWNDEYVGLNGGYTSSNSTIWNNFDNHFMIENNIGWDGTVMNSEFLTQKDMTWEVFTNANGDTIAQNNSMSYAMPTATADMDEVFGEGNYEAEFSDLVADILGNALMYWTRDVGSELNNAECITRYGSVIQAKMQNLLGVRVTINVKTFACV